MFRSSSSPGPKWEALQEPAPSSDDELDAEDGDVDATQAHPNPPRTRDETTRDPPPSTPLAFASTNTSAVVGDNSRSQMKRKESESLFMSKKRARYVQASRSDPDNGMDLDDPTKKKRFMGIDRKTATEQRPVGGLGGRQSGTSPSVSSTTMNRKQSLGNDSTSPSTSASAKPNLPRRPSAIQSPPFLPATRDPPSKLAELPFGTYKRKAVPTSDPGRSRVPASPADKGKAPAKHEQVPSASRITHRPSTSKAKVIPPDAEIIEISDDGDSPSPSISQTNSKSQPIRPSFSKTLSTSQPIRSGSRTARIASGSASRSAIKKFLPKAPIEVIEIFDSDEEQIPSKAQEKKPGRSSGNPLSEIVSATGSNAGRGHISSSGGDIFVSSDGDADVMNVDGEPLSSPQPLSALPVVGSALSDSEDVPLSQELQVAEDTNDNQGTRDLIPLPSSSPSSVGLSPKDDYLSTPSGPAASMASLAISSPPQQPSALTLGHNSASQPITASPITAASISSSPNRLGFLPVTTPSSLPPLPPAKKPSKQFARKTATQPISNEDEEDEDTGEVSSEKKGTANMRVNKGKRKEIRESSSSSGTESIIFRGLRDALAMDSDRLNQLHVSPSFSQKQGQTLAEVITSAGQLNRTKTNMGRRFQGNMKDVPIDLISDVEVGANAATADENEKALKAAIGSSRLLVNLLPTLRERGSVSAAVAATVTEPPASFPQEKRPLLSATRTQGFHTKVEPPESLFTKIGRSSYPLPMLSLKRNTIAHDVPSPKPPSPPPVGMKPKLGSPVEKILGATNTVEPNRVPSTAFEFKSGTAVIEPPKVAPPKKLPLPKRPSAAQIERILAAARDSSCASQQASPSIGLSGHSGGDVPMAEVSSRESILPMSAKMSAASPSTTPVTTLSSILLPLSPLQPALMNGSPTILTKPSKRLTPPKRSPLATTEASPISGVIDSGTSSQQTLSTGTVGHQSGHDDASTVISAPKSGSPKLADLQPTLLSGSNNMRVQWLGKQPSPAAVATANSPEPPVTIPLVSAETPSFRPQPTAAKDSITALEAIQTSNKSNIPPSMHPPASSIVTTSSSDAVIHDEPFGTLGLPFDDSPDDDEEECQALLQTPGYIDVVPSSEVQPIFQDSILVRHKPHDQINPDASVTLPSPLTSVSAIFQASDKHVSVSPPIPGVPIRRSSRISSGRSSRSSSSGGLGTAFDYDFGPFDFVPATRTPSPEVQEVSFLSSPAKTYGGFQALTWKDFRKDLNNFTRRTYYAKDLPHALQDHINSMSEYTQMMEGMRDLFKATILENTVEDEPDAPPIEIWNNVDNQSTPPWEFYYTNNMWLGAGVPPPDIKNLVSCTCKGACNPKSKTCACLLRQKEAAGDPSLEFAYNKHGKLQIPGYPIFECNDLCGCGDECRNRVVQQGRKVSVNIGKTETKGWGVFAGAKKIPEGTFIGIYSGELLTDDEAHERGIKYNKFGRTYLFDIDFHHLKASNPQWEISFTVDAYHAGNFTRFLNHSCDPNCRLYACYINEGNIEKPLLAIFTRRDIEPYEEICFNYQGIYDDEDDEDDEDEGNDPRLLDPDHGKDMIYVRCRCGAKNCTGTMFK